ncbi:MAG: DUF1156 domain-containing protein [Acidobacteria bacterium]|nr:DUF1156 domain-containing protein [Acidobacteriota bacterium]
MATHNDKRLIEDYLPIKAISAEASREKSVRKGHISTLHLWWARRPLVACRAAVYGALVPASRFRPASGPEEKRDSLARANAAKFVERLCKYPGSPQVIAEAQKHILEAHAERLTRETGKQVTVEDIVGGRAPRPKVLDMFAGGGAIPLEALRLGCEAYALDLNPVAHIIELCTLVYPQKYGKPDPTARGMTGPKNDKGETTWGGLAEEVRYWGNWVLEKIKAEIGDLYPPIPDPNAEQEEIGGDPQTVMRFAKGPQERLKIPRGYLTPVAYLWTRTVRCKNPSCGATVPLVRQTWLCKKKGRYVALKVIAPKGEKRVHFEVVEAASEKELGFDPAGFSKGGNATCPFCGTVADNDYVKSEGCAGRMNQQMMAIVCLRSGQEGKQFFSADELGTLLIPDDRSIEQLIHGVYTPKGLNTPSESIANLPPDCRDNTLGIRVRPYGLHTWGDLFVPRQRLCLLAFISVVREAEKEMSYNHTRQDHSIALLTYLGVLVNRLAGFGNSLCGWNYHEQAVANVFGRQAIPMVWDFAEVSIFADMSGGIEGGLNRIVDAIKFTCTIEMPGEVLRGSALELRLPNDTLDSIVTDPPYYDNVPYADLSDFFYVWLKRTIGHLYPEHFTTEGTPKKQEAIADPHRHGGSKERARKAYEEMMAKAFSEAYRVLKPGGQMIIVYAHKTTLGWSTLVDALRQSGFNIAEAWPLDTEYSGRLRSQNSAALASSIFLAARKRDGAATGSYEDEVQPELEQIVRERVETLWEMGVAGADLIIAAVGAGLRAFTRFARVEYANGEEVPAERFLAEVEGVVLETLLEKIFVGQASSLSSGTGQRPVPLSGVDGPSRFYVLWRYTYKAAELDAGEAIVFTYGQRVELDGPNGLSTGSRALVEKKKGKYRLRDYSERGDDEKLGLPGSDGQPAPLIDALHRVLWLMENEPRTLPQFLNEAQPDRERLRLVAQALAGPGLKGKTEEEAQTLITTTASEQAALGKLTANWRTLMADLPLFEYGRKSANDAKQQESGSGRIR